MQLSTRLVVTMVLIQAVMLATLVWNSGRIIKGGYIEQIERTNATELTHLQETVSIGLIYADRAMLAESLAHMRSRADFSYAIIYDRKNRIMASSGDVPENPSHVKVNASYAQSVETGVHHLSSKVNKQGQFLGTFQVGFKTDQVRELVVSSQQQNILIAIITFVLTLTASILLGRYITSNLRLLEHGARKFSEGKLDYRIEQVSDNAINDVTNAFNTLAENLQSTVNEVNERNSSLSESESQVRLLLDSTEEAIFGLDMAGKCTFANPACVNMLGYQDADQLSGRDMHNLVHHKRADGAPYPEEECPILKVLHTGNSSHDDTEMLWRADGSSFPAEYWSRPIYHENRLTGAVVSFLDITERNKNESELRAQRDFNNAILNAAGNLIIVLDLEGRFVHFNRAAEELTGYSRNEALGKSIWQLVIPEEQKSGVKAVFENLRKGDIEISGEYDNEWLTRDGGRRLLHWNNSVLHDDNGAVSHIMTLGYDITDQKVAELEHTRVQNELRQAQKMESLGHLTGGIAHDFNNLLGIINGYAGLTLDKLDDGESKPAEYVRNIQEAGERATNLVTQMLAFSRSDQVEDIPIQLSLSVKEDIKMLRATLPSSIEIENHIDLNLPNVLMNPTQLHQILMNLSINARDAMDGSGKLTIRLGWARDLNIESMVSHKSIKGDWIELSISDTGSGIDTEIVKKIFNPFFTTKEVGEGTGLGLSVIYRIMENHGGHILVESELGKGTTFRMLFAPDLEENNDVPDLGYDVDEIQEGDGSEILVVDDEPMLAVHMSELIKGHGYEATFVTDSTEALTLFRKDPDRFSMLITDQTMPKMTGMELIKNLREIRPELPVIMNSGYSDKIDSKGAEQLDISYFKKPVNVNKLLFKIAELLGGSKFTG